MENETVKKGRIERYRDRDGSPITGIIFLVFIIVLLYFSVTTGANLAYGGFNKVYTGYPNSKYEDLEKEFDNIIVENKYIDMQKLSDSTIEFTETYFKSNSYPREKWEISLENKDIKVSSVIKKSEDGTLELRTMRDTSKVGFYINRTLGIIGIIIICIIISGIAFAVFFSIYFFIIDRLIDIERKYIAKKAKATVSKKDKS